jgi:hypothetical protein
MTMTGRPLDTPLGERFGHLTVLDDAEPIRSGKRQRAIRRVLVRCDCGRELPVWLSNVRSGNTQSCHRGDCPYSRKLHPHWYPPKRQEGAA